MCLQHFFRCLKTTISPEPIRLLLVNFLWRHLLLLCHMSTYRLACLCSPSPWVYDSTHDGSSASVERVPLNPAKTNGRFPMMKVPGGQNMGSVHSFVEDWDMMYLYMYIYTVVSCTCYFVYYEVLLIYCYHLSLLSLFAYHYYVLYSCILLGFRYDVYVFCFLFSVW